jgi:hypothetical protein
VIECGYIGLDVQEGSAVDDVHVLDMEGAVLDADEAYDGEADRVGPPWDPGGEDSM